MSIVSEPMSIEPIMLEIIQKVCTAVFQLKCFSMIACLETKGPPMFVVRIPRREFALEDCRRSRKVSVL